MPAYELLQTWLRQIDDLLPGERISRVRNLALLIVGLYLGKSVHANMIASRLPFEARLRSTAERIGRFLRNPAFRPRAWYRPIAIRLLLHAAVHGIVKLIVDGSKVGSAHQLLMISLAFRKRALPIAWTWVRCARGHSGSTKQLALLDYVKHMLPAGAQVEIVGDCEFGSIAILQQLELWHWRYVLRQKGSTLVCVSKIALTWQRFGTLISQRKQPAWYPDVILTQTHLHHTHLLAYWKPTEPEPWLLATNIPDSGEALRAYRRRMWIEEMFGDWKGHGVDLEHTHLRHFQRLSRLTMAVALLYVWLVTSGSQAIKAGNRALVDRKGRRDLSIFRIGLYIIDRYCALGHAFTVRLVPYW